MEVVHGMLACGDDEDEAVARYVTCVRADSARFLTDWTAWTDFLYK